MDTMRFGAIMMTFSFRFVALGVFAGMGVAVLAEGCGPGDTRYYCDASGCYDCDGYGCHPVAPPTNTSCTGNSQCATNQICTSEGCIAICKADGDCPKGDVCKSGLCVAPTATIPTAVACAKDSDCGPNQECVGSGGFAKCEDKANVCQYSSECGAGKVCANGECLPDCSQANATCAAGETCEKGVCEPSSTQCTSDGQCSGSTPKCEQGQCVAACDPNNLQVAACDAGYVCENGACVIDTHPTPNCGNGGAQCLATQECLDGFCRYTCTTPDGKISQSCELIDTRIGYCAKDSTCRNAQEAAGVCLKAADCTDGKSCISNTCL